MAREQDAMRLDRSGDVDRLLSARVEGDGRRLSGRHGRRGRAAPRGSDRRSRARRCTLGPGQPRSCPASCSSRTARKARHARGVRAAQAQVRGGVGRERALDALGEHEPAQGRALDDVGAAEQVRATEAPVAGEASISGEAVGGAPSSSRSWRRHAQRRSSGRQHRARSPARDPRAQRGSRGGTRRSAPGSARARRTPGIGRAPRGEPPWPRGAHATADQTRSPHVQVQCRSAAAPRAGLRPSPLRGGAQPSRRARFSARSRTVCRCRSAGRALFAVRLPAARLWSVSRHACGAPRSAPVARLRRATVGTAAARQRRARCGAARRATRGGGSARADWPTPPTPPAGPARAV